VSLVLAALLGGFSWLAVEVWRLDVYGCWVLVCLWVWIAAAVYLVRFWQGKWRGMRVIETDSTAESSGSAPLAAAE
jgi:hypothetical protein